MGGTSTLEPGILELPNGSLRVRVYAGINPITKSKQYLDKTIPAGPRALRLAQRTRTAFRYQVDQGRAPRTNATVNELLDAYFGSWTGEDTTLTGYKELTGNHVRPLIGKTAAKRVTAKTLEDLYFEYRRCRKRCTPRKRGVDHRTHRPHECDKRCHPHRCSPLAVSTIRQIHSILSGAYAAGCRWEWLSVNPALAAKQPKAPTPNPQPPTSAEMAAILNGAWRDPDWGAFTWTSAVSGSRRGETCAVRGTDITVEHVPPQGQTTPLVTQGSEIHHALARPDDHDSGAAACTAVVRIERQISQDGSIRVEKPTKTHQQRDVVVDTLTLCIWQAVWSRAEDRAGALGHVLARDAFLFSLVPGNDQFILPDTVTQRYRRLVDALGIDTTIHKLRHYSATELIQAGVDIRTVAARLGHGGGGTTTLRFYAAPMSLSAQRASEALLTRFGSLPTTSVPMPAGENLPDQVAGDLREQIETGALRHGEPLPTLKEISLRYSVSDGTASMALTKLKECGLAEARRGVRATVIYPSTDGAVPEAAAAAGPVASLSSSGGVDAPLPEDVRAAAPSAVGTSIVPIGATDQQLVELVLYRLGGEIRRWIQEADPHNPEHLRRMLTAGVRRSGASMESLDDFDMDVRVAETKELITTFAALAA